MVRASPHLRRSTRTPSRAVRLEVEDRLAGQLAGDGTGCLTYEQVLAETERLLSEAVDADGLLAQYRLYLQERSARAAAFRARRVAGVSVQSDFRASEIRESS